MLIFPQVRFEGYLSLGNGRRNRRCLINPHGLKSTPLPLDIRVCPGDLRVFGVCTDDRDEQYLSKLRGLGMSSEDEWKLYALRQHIFKISQLQLKYSLPVQPFPPYLQVV